MQSASALNRCPPKSPVKRRATCSTLNSSPSSSPVKRKATASAFNCSLSLSPQKPKTTNRLDQISHASLRAETPKPSPLRLPTNVKGKDLFDSVLWNDVNSTAVFYRFIASLREKIREDVRQTTPTHRFIRLLRDRRKLVRCYTQNVDGLEAREGLCMDLNKGKGNRTRFTKKAMAQTAMSGAEQEGGILDGGCEVVQLHGDLEKLRCSLCQNLSEWTDQNRRQLLAGKAPQCQSCTRIDQDRQDRGKRGTKVGNLRPNVVLYGENHPSSDALGKITTFDLSTSPDLLLILGTSLRVHGLKTMIREFAKAVHARAGGRGKVIFVNLSRPAESVWKDSLDYWVSMDCDAWTQAVRRHRPDLWQIQAPLSMPVQKKKKESQILSSQRFDEEEKENIPDMVKSASEPKPSVVVPETPQKKSFGQDDLSAASRRRHEISPSPSPSKPSLAHAKWSREPSSSLPTPPNTKAFHGQKDLKSLKHKLDSIDGGIDHTSRTPTKRRKGVIKIWEDEVETG